MAGRDDAAAASRSASSATTSSSKVTIGSGSAEVEAETRAFLEATLRRVLELVEALREERLPADGVGLLVVIQFEEIFQFRHPAERDGRTR